MTNDSAAHHMESPEGETHRKYRDQISGWLDKVLASAFSLSAENERSMISSRTKEALARKQSAGKRLGRPKGSDARETNLTGKEAVIHELLSKRLFHSAIARILGVKRGTVASFVKR